MQLKTSSSETAAAVTPAVRGKAPFGPFNRTLFRKNLTRFWPLWAVYTILWVIMDPSFEAGEVKVFGEMYKKGYIYKGLKPVYWCPRDETALAEAEIEYQDDPCTTVYVKFPMDSEMKIAVLFDAENIAGKYTEVILNEANNLGNVIIKRIYGDWTSRQMSSWKEVILNNSIQPIQQYSNVSGKNSSDSALIIDAMGTTITAAVCGRFFRKISAPGSASTRAPSARTTPPNRTEHGATSASIRRCGSLRTAS